MSYDSSALWDAIDDDDDEDAEREWRCPECGAACAESDSECPDCGEAP